MEFYDRQCFFHIKGIPERLTISAGKSQETRPLDNAYSTSYQSDITNKNTKSEVTCNQISCEITNACITSSSGITLFGSSDYVKQEKRKYAGSYLHNILLHIA